MRGLGFLVFSGSSCLCRGCITLPGSMSTRMKVFLRAIIYSYPK